MKNLKDKVSIHVLKSLQGYSLLTLNIVDSKTGELRKENHSIVAPDENLDAAIELLIYIIEDRHCIFAGIHYNKAYKLFFEDSINRILMRHEENKQKIFRDIKQEYCKTYNKKETNVHILLDSKGQYHVADLEKGTIKVLKERKVKCYQ